MHEGTAFLATPSHIKESSTEISLPTSVDVSRGEAGDSFTRLLLSRELQELLAHYPSLRSQLKKIYRATLKSSKESSNHQFADQSDFEGRYGKRKGKGKFRGGPKLGNENSRPTQQRGLENAYNLMKSTRASSGDCGTGVTEFCLLVTKLQHTCHQ